MGSQEDKSPALFHNGLRRRLLRMLRDAHSRGVMFCVFLNKRMVTGFLHLPLERLGSFPAGRCLKMIQGPWG